MTAKPLLFLLFLFIAHGAVAQGFIYLKKKTSAKSIQLKLYDRVDVMLQDQTLIKGTITGIEEDFFFVDGEECVYKEIEWVRTHNLFFRGLGTSLMIGSALFTGVFTANSAINGDQPILTNGNIAFIGSLLVVGGATNLLSRKKRHMKKWRIEAIIPE